mgnify:CR=1 FL=1
MKALEEAIELGFDTILTSGQKETAWEGREMLKALQEKSAGRIEILAASGIGAESIEKLLPYTGITSYHMSGKIVVDSAMKYRKRRNRTWIVRAWRLCALADFGRRNRESSKGFKNNRLTSTERVLHSLKKTVILIDKGKNSNNFNRRKRIMIKVIASDMDGTLLGDNHKVAPETVEAIREAQAAGIRFMIATGRSYNGAMEELKDLDLGCDFIVGSGAEVRNPKGEILKSIGFTYEVCNEVAKVLEEYPISVLYCAGPYEYRVGTPEEVEESIVRQIQLFIYLSAETNRAVRTYKRVKASSRRIDSVDELEKQGIIIHKIFLFTGDLEMLDKIKRRLMQNPELAVASSFYNNLEITVKGAEKGPAIQEYIESLGYTKDEVMVFGDSLNDYSMLSMDFGATVAMENADDEVKQVSKYVTKSNEDLGVAYTIHELLKKQGKTNSNC